MKISEFFGYVYIYLFLNFIPIILLVGHNHFKVRKNINLKLPALFSYIAYFILSILMGNYIPDLHIAFTVPLTFIAALGVFYLSNLIIKLLKTIL